MATIDPEKERRRLVEFYTGQMDGELEKVAGQAYELTELAREALRAELSRRGIAPILVEQAPVFVNEKPDPQPGDPPPPSPQLESQPDGEIEWREVVTIRQFRDLPEAVFAKGSLESAGIVCALVDDNMVRLDWFISNLLGGVKLQVAAEDADAANEILSQPIPEDFDATGTGEYHQPRCPKCGSLDVNFRETAPAAYIAAWVIMPIPFHRRAWRCHSCRVEWEDDSMPSSD
jgi:hypothetical protein